MADLSRDIGALEARTDAHDERLKRIEDKIDTLTGYIQENKGGIKTLIAVGSISATLAAGFAEFVHWWHK